MPNASFAAVATVDGSEKWEKAIEREEYLYPRDNEIRSHFERDYTRILHCTAYRRLKHKTQVFFATTNDHVCTRIGHVNHVNSVSRTISKYLGLNLELVDAISIGHDLGHAPFGHKGEDTLKSILKNTINGNSFWHEKNSLHFVDDIEILEGPKGRFDNLKLTYGVRDGIVCHCGEIDENSLFPRDNPMGLKEILEPNKVKPFTWEGCVVKVSDKIAYLGRDIEDAITLKVLTADKLDELNDLLKSSGVSEDIKINNTVLIHTFITDLCQNSSPASGIALSDQIFSLMKSVKSFCYKNIYSHVVLERYKNFVDHILKGLFDFLLDTCKNFCLFGKEKDNFCPKLSGEFVTYLKCYSKGFGCEDKFSKIKKIYDLSNTDDWCFACVDYISGMTDQYAISRFKEIITY